MVPGLAPFKKPDPLEPNDEDSVNNVCAWSWQDTLATFRNTYGDMSVFMRTPNRVRAQSGMPLATRLRSVQALAYLPERHWHKSQDC